uniref:UORF n=1 Tax=Trypanosoma cruzi TaxID=5693 RepID=A0A076JQM3_TRYCR|nr:uORF [Trypanosoma cruzi]AII77631.1 uORF [Trypanosoma cruzi]AII77636.1 uORF [Trypanosoma cruzi]AII77641.1 uORF [Trypanosoma cruzi]AII77646.1 uORF [Trypanosoma cruzi]
MKSWSASVTVFCQTSKNGNKT